MVLAGHILSILEKYNLNNKIFYGDNCNPASATLQEKRQRTVKLSKSIKMSILEADCDAHIVHTILQTSLDLEAVDVLTVVNEVFQYLLVFTVIDETLNSSCEFVKIGYIHILVSVKTRRLSMLPAVERWKE